MEAVFRCRHLSADAFISWQINESPVGQFPDITTGSANDNGTLVNTLIIPATPKYNGTKVVCVAFIAESLPDIAPAVTLIVSITAD